MAYVSKEKIMKIVDNYDKENITIATVCSHSSLQIFNGARREGFKTLGIAVEKIPRFYDAFPLGKPDDFILVDDYSEIVNCEEELIDKNAIVVPHGSFVEYMGIENFAKLAVPTFGNRRVLEWESNRNKERYWLESAGIQMPRKIEKPAKIDRPVLVKYDGAKGGRGYFIAKDYAEFKIGIDYSKKYTIQEYILGTRYYLHYFYSPIDEGGYRLSKGSLYLMGIDRRDESNIDEMYKLGSQEELKKYGLFPSFVVTGNVPVVLRESLLEKAFEMGASVVETSFSLFGGIIGPFCLESIVTDNLEFRVFEISARIVAGTNLYISGSPYSNLIEENMSTGRRIAREIKTAIKLGLLHEVLS